MRELKDIDTSMTINFSCNFTSEGHFEKGKWVPGLFEALFETNKACETALNQFNERICETADTLLNIEIFGYFKEGVKITVTVEDLLKR